MARLATYYRSLVFYQRYYGFISEASHRVYGPNIRRTHSQTLIVEGTKPVLRWPVARRSYIGPSSTRLLFLSFFLIKLHSRSSYSSVVHVYYTYPRDDVERGKENETEKSYLPFCTSGVHQHQAACKSFHL